ncbi:TspO/MBR family protein [Flammeovirga kamogawensis]|uniref:Tryptophan-rich sensory protein n=1 Tax=Flammeovirga kamogawensis TaxID=373891 RepID=A0ABX8H2X9_9BACT|nr:TspO/MBR family protein [Flammeovirga kamogawensis]MBB6463741.1 tryptophan-rich sensory protein [Flammeovirga kamogawensis]QWG09747.1 tryptophan-rich sensory protein [Flammeovirga kamogawensis]TRX65260.1 tryptophan-rich sensory protein [Flammeovirga kamogawensis]
MVIRIIIFLLINFLGLGIGGFFTGKGVPSEWYQTLNKAPWTPPGWVFGFAWSTIMLLFSVYLGALWNKVLDKNVFMIAFGSAFLLNVLWNPVFFYFHYMFLGLIVIVLLSMCVMFFIFKYQTEMRWLTLLIAPYIIWLCIATSLNAYAVIFN